MEEKSVLNSCPDNYNNVYKKRCTRHGTNIKQIKILSYLVVHSSSYCVIIVNLIMIKFHIEQQGNISIQKSLLEMIAILHYIQYTKTS